MNYAIAKASFFVAIYSIEGVRTKIISEDWLRPKFINQVDHKE